MNLAVLIPAVLSYVRYTGGYATKTKLLKLLYLLDIESFREKQATLTDFNWRFHKYGPWSPEYDEVLDRLNNSNMISMRTGNKTEWDAVFVDAVKRVDLSEAFPAVLDELRARRIIEAWADRPTGELLEYVYFHTAPMRNARRGELLDFSGILGEEPVPEYKRTHSLVEPKERKKKQKAFREAIRQASNHPSGIHIRKPRYDAVFWKAIDTLDREPD